MISIGFNWIEVIGGSDRGRESRPPLVLRCRPSAARTRNGVMAAAELENALVPGAGVK